MYLYYLPPTVLQKATIWKKRTNFLKMIYTKWIFVARPLILFVQVSGSHFEFLRMVSKIIIFAIWSHHPKWDEIQGSVY